MVNEIGIGGAWGPTYFSFGVTPDHFSDQGGYNLGFNLVTGATTASAPSSRQASNWFVEDTMTWTRGKHNIAVGGTFTQFNLWLTNQTLVPGVNFGLNTTVDPANPMFTTTNFPGASNNQLNEARLLYALLSGRVTSINGNVRLNPDTGLYDYLGSSTARGRMNEFGAYVQDSWRISSTVTANIGVRYQLQMPFQPQNDIYSMVTFDNLCGVSGVGQGPEDRNCNLFKPGTLTGSPSVYQAYDAGNPGYNTDFNNLAPSVGMTWRPNAQSGFWRTLLGDPEQAVVRGAYSVAYNRNGMGDFSGTYGGNPGQTITTNRNVANGNLALPGESWPVLLRENSRLGPPATCAGAPTAACVPASPSYPLVATTANDLNLFDPELQISFSRLYRSGFSVPSAATPRSRSATWAPATSAAGRTRTGTPSTSTRTVSWTNGRPRRPIWCSNQATDEAIRSCIRGPARRPCPSTWVYFQGLNNVAAHIQGNYTSSNFTNNARLKELSRLEPNVGGAAGTLLDSATFRQNALNAGLARNFFIMNPDVGDAVITRSKSFTKYDSLQIDIRRRLSRGFLVQGSYVFAHRYGSALDDLHFERYLGGAPSGTIPHNFKVNWVDEILSAAAAGSGSPMTRG